MPFVEKKNGFHWSPKGKLKLPPAAPGLAKVPGLKITWKTPVKPALPKPK